MQWKVDHETALEAANQALSSGRRAESRISSVELNNVSTTRLGEHAPSRASASRLSTEGWQIAGMIVVAVATLSVVVGLWLM